MKCPHCGFQESKVVDSRHSEDGTSIRRRRIAGSGQPFSVRALRTGTDSTRQ